ncbi:MAG: hypothetical protein M3Q07_12625 [Pseudobdellovibrionaceae bacterium]|nr:hypothetical protein [Pseudobdellovibrionaceae bacterium]
MMKKLKITALVLTLGAAPLACNQDPQADTSDLSWGHLKDQSLHPDAPQYLINKKPGETYKVCVPQYMVNELPGVESEIKAAINIWAAYLGRTIEVETQVMNLPRAGATDTTQTLQTKYYSTCGDDFDVVVGFAPLKGTTVAQTGSSWRGYSAQKITSFKRHLFLRDYKITPDAWGTNRWISLQALNKQTLDSSQILSQMQGRGDMEVSPTAASIALPVLVHEFGHVWGLCDQYEGPTNCDPSFKSTHPDMGSIMAAASNIAKLYLTDDDITGIRALAKRPGFNSSWPGTDDDIIKVPAPITRHDVEIFKLKSVEKVGTQFTLHFGLVTTKGGELRFEYRPKGTATWQKISTYFPSEGGFMIPDYSIRQTLTAGTDYEFRMNLRLRNADNSLGMPMYSLL